VRHKPSGASHLRGGGAARQHAVHPGQGLALQRARLGVKGWTLQIAGGRASARVCPEYTALLIAPPIIANWKGVLFLCTWSNNRIQQVGVPKQLQWQRHKGPGHKRARQQERGHGGVRGVLQQLDGGEELGF